MPGRVSERERQMLFDCCGEIKKEEFFLPPSAVDMDGWMVEVVQAGKRHSYELDHKFISLSS